MVSWGELGQLRPDLVDGGRALLYQHGVGLAFLATVRLDGGPRLHPFCPIIAGTELFAFVIPSPKQRDLVRDARYAVHSFPTPVNEDAFYLSGVVEMVCDANLRTKVGEQFVQERSDLGVPLPAPEDLLVRFDVSTCLLTRTKGFGDWEPHHEVWHQAE